MQAQLPIQPHEDGFEQTAHEVSQLRDTRDLLPEAPQSEDEGLPTSKAGADLPQDADADLLLQAIQKREQRSFVLKFTGILGGLALAAYLAGSGNGAIVQGVIHLAVGAAAGATGALLYAKRRSSAGD